MSIGEQGELVQGLLNRAIQTAQLQPYETTTGPEVRTSHHERVTSSGH